MIQGYYARLDPKAMDLPLLVFVEMPSTKSGEIFEAFRREVLPAVRAGPIWCPGILTT